MERWRSASFREFESHVLRHSIKQSLNRDFFNFGKNHLNNFIIHFQFSALEMETVHQFSKKIDKEIKADMYMKHIDKEIDINKFDVK